MSGSSLQASFQASTPTLAGTGVTLRSLTLDDAPALFAITPPDTFTYFLSEPRAWTLDAFTTWLRDYLLGPAHMSFAVIDDHTRALVGSTSFLDILPQHRHAEIGITWYAHHARGTHINPASKYLLLDYAFTRMFDNRGALRITLKCNAKNEHSKRAITKLGATYEGTLRNHRVKELADGTGQVRDTAYFSILPSEWPAISPTLLARAHAALGTGS
jgi:RimJ/RimL family protein N-acetyltransferase